MYRITKYGSVDRKKEYPLILRRDVMEVQKDSNFPCVYPMKLPVYPKSINLRIQTDCRHELTEYNLREAKVIQQSGEWYILLCIDRDIRTRTSN